MGLRGLILLQAWVPGILELVCDDLGVNACVGTMPQILLDALGHLRAVAVLNHGENAIETVLESALTALHDRLQQIAALVVVGGVAEATPLWMVDHILATGQPLPQVLHLPERVLVNVKRSQIVGILLCQLISEVDQEFILENFVGHGPFGRFLRQLAFEDT